MLQRTSRFVLEVMPYLLSALIALLLVPSFIFSQAQGAKVVAVPYTHDAVVIFEGVGTDRIAHTQQGAVRLW